MVRSDAVSFAVVGTWFDFGMVCWLVCLLFCSGEAVSARLMERWLRVDEEGCGIGGESGGDLLCVHEVCPGRSAVLVCGCTRSGAELADEDAQGVTFEDAVDDLLRRLGRFLREAVELVEGGEVFLRM